MTNDGDRHLSRDGLLDYLAAAPTAVRVDGEPTVYLVVDPPARRLALRVARHHGDEPPDVGPYRHFTTSTVSWNGAPWLELAVDDGDALVDAYPVLCAVADRVQLEGAHFGRAVIDALTTYRELLARTERLSEEEEAGLFGELLVLAHLLRAIPPADALASWQGPNAEEHDFALHDFDVEVKTTRAESRRHWINDLSQLVPSPGRNLWLVSIQLTAAGASGSTLPSLVDHVVTALGDDTLAAAFRAALQHRRWTNEHASLYRSSLALRSTPAVFRVDRTFPSITPTALVDAGLDIARFPKVRYLVDMTGMAEDPDPPVIIAAALASPGIP